MAPRFCKPDAKEEDGPSTASLRLVLHVLSQHGWHKEEKH
jgi:hypothetical protein